MAGEIKRVYGTQKTLQSAGSTVASGSISAAASSTYATADSADYPDAVFALTIAPASAVTANTSIDLVLRPLNFDGTSDASVPTATYLHHYFGSFRPTSSGSQTLYLEARDVPKEFEAYIYNNATGQATGSWTLKVTPASYVPI